MLQKISNLLLIVCSIGIVLPQLLLFFADQENALLMQIPWAWIILFSGMFGILIQVILVIKNKKGIHLSGIFLLLSFILLIVGFTLKELHLNFKIVLLMGVLSFGIWFIIPAHKKSNNNDI